jgi:uncharacterized RDD family membrane protein YckC
MPGWHYAGFWVRFLAFLIDAIALGLLTSALIWAAFDSRKQGWHDKIASTVVIRPN